MLQTTDNNPVAAGFSLRGSLEASGAQPGGCGCFPWKTSLSSSAGFTLVEVLAALAILALAMGMMILPFMMAMGYVGKGRARAEAQQNARQVMNVLEEELSEAMDVLLLPGDPGICAFVPAQPGTFPLQPGNTVIRYWQIWRSDPNAADPASGSPINKSWYDKFSPVPRYNQATAKDTDSRFIARTELPQLWGDLDADLDTDSKADALERDYPAASGNSIQDKQKFVAISPSRANSDVPVLRFDATTQVNERLKRDSNSAYVFHSRYPLWEYDWVVSVYNSTTGDLDLQFNSTTDPGYVGPYGGQRGEVNFAVSQIETTEDPNYPLTITTGALTSTIQLMTAQPDSSIPPEAVIVPGTVRVIAYQGVDGGTPIDPLVLTEVPVSALPALGQYKLNNPANAKGAAPPPTLEILNLSLPLGANTPVAVSYQWSVLDPNTDLVIASYRTRALLKVSLTVSQRDSKDGEPQDVHLERRVKLKNVVD
ncbi:MAG: prepilin-type N-terminal cleavage/methylation domain-containing protein [Armatimonadetes bacterium]|nr:prepilin-type N-terminal cleavage/methylation domain-containing protein [Armatimonadota bacterium]NIM23708.1 prepilin-type N-terminal cleavage/methylation domain-containing protein [Armatimonadota bacterium]NIM67585.1 prepilin-type N-terminal cleavage/methylation domain-containing protein [Armatimonadota bacterium]NIM76108.1 prepilin-type N-terminal cleavage/methylation domain-containing protein [Armatimonadota bacterium]NIN05791.1 prepilin-type N-terminal cleavage/methylation domain-contain